MQKLINQVTFKKFLLKIWGVLLVSLSAWIIFQGIQYSTVNPEVSFLSAINILTMEYLQVICELIERTGLWAWVIIFGIYILRPFLLIPASVLTILSAMLFGPIYGLIVTMIGENIAANTSFGVARYFASSVHSKPKGMLPKIGRFVENHSLSSVLFLRVAWVPFDMVSYGFGFTKIPWSTYAIGTFIGILPGMLTIVLLGTGGRHGAEYIGLGIGFLIITVFISIICKQLLSRRRA